ncbi:hypothetical protein OnM2_058048 [Erysiphe neolycopersici]|uniref:Uncharacterized protein n=1 Tax=Erysiphe neolycopersici TaxID=212602 RepID=A0A420HQE1_9PEZI|nr:hypothetical protein OnM2_058048 [Erysiphe neolycopersici]
MVDKKKEFLISKALNDILKNEDEHIWTHEEITQQENVAPFNSIHRSNVILNSEPSITSRTVGKTPDPQLRHFEEKSLGYLPMSQPARQSPIRPTETIIRPAPALTLQRTRNSLNPSPIELPHPEQFYRSLNQKPPQTSSQPLQLPHFRPHTHYSLPQTPNHPQQINQHISPFNQPNFQNEPATHYNSNFHHPSIPNQRHSANSKPPNPQIPKSNIYPRLHTLENLPTRELENLAKTYRNEYRYGGAEDNLDLCLGIFYDICSKTGIKQQFYKDAFSFMLKESARQYYHMYIMNHDHSFENMIIMLKSHFETEERQQQLMVEWKNINLKNIIENNQHKTNAECFEMVVDKLRKIQIGLQHRYQGDLTLRDVVIDAVRDVRECSFACYKPASTFEAFCAVVRASITAERRLKNVASTSATFKTFPSTYIEPHDDQLYIDRQYKGIQQYITECEESSPSNTPPISPIDVPTSFIFTHSTRYSDAIFQGVMIDTGAARVSTAGESQFRALCKIQKLEMDRSQAGQANICFCIGTARLIGPTSIETPFGEVIFHIMPSNTPFLYHIF